MISYLKGKIITKTNTSVIVLVNNIGYRVFLNVSLLNEIKVETEMEFYLHQYIREDAINLYGFKNLADLELFELLITVSGVGPKSALNVLAIASGEEVRSSIANGDSALLIKVSGIGKKTAERLVLELRNKIVAGKNIDPGAKGSDGFVSDISDEIDALMALGYTMQQAGTALKKVADGKKDSGEKIRAALKLLAK